MSGRPSSSKGEEPAGQVVPAKARPTRPEQAAPLAVNPAPEPVLSSSSRRRARRQMIAASMLQGQTSFGDDEDDAERESFLAKARRRGGVAAAKSSIEKREVLGTPWPVRREDLPSGSWNAVLGDAQAEGVTLRLEANSAPGSAMRGYLRILVFDDATLVWTKLSMILYKHI